MKKIIVFLVLIFSLLIIQEALAETNESLSLAIISPESKTYNTNGILFNFSVNKVAEINYKLNENITLGCINCIEFIDVLNLGNGNYTLVVTASDVNETDNETIEFSIHVPEEQPEVFNLTVNKPEKTKLTISR